MRLWSCLTLLPVAVIAAPNACVDRQFCRINLGIINSLKQDNVASAFCVSYLGLETVTVSTTSTVEATPGYNTKYLTLTAGALTSVKTALQVTTQTQTVTATTVQTVATSTVTSTTSTSYIPCLNSAYTASAPIATLARRSVQNQRPACIPKDWNSNKVSSACSCLSVTGPTTTLTATEYQTPTPIAVTLTDTITPVISLAETSISTSTSITTTTVIQTTTETVTAYAVATSVYTGGNGLNYRKFTHTFNADDPDTGFTSTFFKDLTPDWTGILDILTFATVNWPSVTTLILPDGRNFDSSQAAMLLNGFFVAQEEGLYTLGSSGDYIDNWGYLWTGSNAYQNWNDDNTDFQASRTAPPYVGGSVQIHMNQGDAIPLTWLWANGGGAGQSYFSITTPSGDFTTDTTGYFAAACNTNIFA